MMDFYLQLMDSDFGHGHDVHEIDPSQLDNADCLDDNPRHIERIGLNKFDEQEGELLRALKWNEQNDERLDHSMKRGDEWYEITDAIAHAKMGHLHRRTESMFVFQSEKLTDFGNS